jgi:prepilin-type N-terminal cleavage/methylation domain-containing protein
MHRIFKENRGLTLIELLVALVLSALIIAALYRTFLGQQKTYMVQEQVVEMRQNLRGAISNMMRELRMTGFGSVATLLPVTFGSGLNAVTYQNVVNRNMPSTVPSIMPGTEWITIVTALTSSWAKLKGPGSGTEIVVSNYPDFDIDFKKDDDRKYISIGGLESRTITDITNDGDGNKKLKLNKKLIYVYPDQTKVYPIRAITYAINIKGELRRDDHVGGAQPITGEGTIENIQYRYQDAEGSDVASDAAVQMIRVRITATTDPTIRAADLLKDPKLPKTGDGLLKREITSNVQLRNVISSP